MRQKLTNLASHLRGLGITSVMIPVTEDFIKKLNAEVGNYWQGVHYKFEGVNFQWFVEVPFDAIDIPTIVVDEEDLLDLGPVGEQGIPGDPGIQLDVFENLEPIKDEPRTEG
jgi:hypothetical protein